MYGFAITYYYQIESKIYETTIPRDYNTRIFLSNVNSDTAGESEIVTLSFSGAFSLSLSILAVLSILFA